jgi:hypothetical protein
LIFASALTTNAQTPPASLQILDYGYDFVKLSAQTNASGDNILIAITDVPLKNVWGDIIEGGTFGTPTGTYQVDDEIVGGGTVVYIGGSSDDIVINGLDHSVLYHLKAWSLNGSGNYSTGDLTANFHTWGKVPYHSNYLLVELTEIPLDWKLDQGNIYMQETTWKTGCLQTDPLNGTVVTPAVVSLTTQWILLAAGKNRLFFNYYMSSPWSFGGFYDALTSEDWVEGSFIQIQLSTDGDNFVAVYTINKDNAYDFKYPRIQDNLAVFSTPEFNQFNGERVKVRFFMSLRMTAQFYMEDVYIEQTEIPECDGVFNIEANPMIGGIADISWRSFDEDADLWEIRYREVGTPDWTEPEETTTETYTLKDLPFETKIEVQVRVVCSSVLSSDWTSFIFTSGKEFEPCMYPVNLNVTEITESSAQLSWEEGNEENLSWDLHYRESLSTWNDVEDLDVKEYLLKELLPETVYLWSVRAHCSSDRTSPWATQINFKTDPAGINSVKADAMTVFSSGKMLNILNHKKIFIEKVQLFSITGTLLGDYKVYSADNILIPTVLSEMIIFVKIIAQNEVETYKVLVR